MTGLYISGALPSMTSEENPVGQVWRYLIYLKRKASSKPVFTPGSCAFPESHWPLFQQKL